MVRVSAILTAIPSRGTLLETRESGGGIPLIMPFKTGQSEDRHQFERLATDPTEARSARISADLAPGRVAWDGRRCSALVSCWHVPTRGAASMACSRLQPGICPKRRAHNAEFLGQNKPHCLCFRAPFSLNQGCFLDE